MPHNLTDVDTFSSPIAVPSDGDVQNAASIETTFQQLANRTKNLDVSRDDHETRVTTLEEAADGSSVVADYGSSRAIFIPASRFVGVSHGSGSTPALVTSGTPNPSLALNLPKGDNDAWSELFYEFDREIPAGATITQARSLINLGASRSSIFRASVEIQSNSTQSGSGTLSAGAWAASAIAANDGGAASGLRTISATGSLAVAAPWISAVSFTGLRYRLRVKSGGEAGGSEANTDVFYGVWVVWSDPGPRNF